MIDPSSSGYSHISETLEEQIQLAVRLLQERIQKEERAVLITINVGLSLKLNERIHLRKRPIRNQKKIGGVEAPKPAFRNPTTIALVLALFTIQTSLSARTM